MITKTLLIAILILGSMSLVTGGEKWVLADATRQKCIALLQKSMRSAEFWPSMHAAEALFFGGYGKDVTEFLEPRLTEELDDQHRCGLARELVRCGDSAKSAVLFGILKSPENYAHVHAAESLYKVGYPGDDSVLQTVFAGTVDPRLKLMAAAALGKHSRGEKRDDALRFLRVHIQTETDPELFRLSAWVLGDIGNEDDKALIRQRLLDTNNPTQKSYLIHALAQLGDPAGRTALLANFESEVPAIRTSAAVIAGKSGIVEAAPLLVRQLNDRNLDARVRAAQGLLVLSR
ncbi:MAG: HEAT repeat domain-containing protein [Verrucomicrobiales bacterium]|nr:HEAT repeat domain-containing protein [Verrucomicrobiales bacterium]